MARIGGASCRDVPINSNPYRGMRPKRPDVQCDSKFEVEGVILSIIRMVCQSDFSTVLFIFPLFVLSGEQWWWCAFSKWRTCVFRDHGWVRWLVGWLVSWLAGWCLCLTLDWVWDWFCVVVFVGLRIKPGQLAHSAAANLFECYSHHSVWMLPALCSAARSNQFNEWSCVVTTFCMEGLWAWHQHFYSVGLTCFPLKLFISKYPTETPARTNSDVIID